MTLRIIYIAKVTTKISEGFCPFCKTNDDRLYRVQLSGGKWTWICEGCRKNKVTP